MSKGKDLINSIKYGLYRMLTLFLHVLFSGGILNTPSDLQKS